MKLNKEWTKTHTKERMAMWPSRLWNFPRLSACFLVPVGARRAEVLPPCLGNSMKLQIKIQPIKRSWRSSLYPVIRMNNRLTTILLRCPGLRWSGVMIDRNWVRRWGYREFLLFWWWIRMVPLSPKMEEVMCQVEKLLKKS